MLRSLPFFLLLLGAGFAVAKRPNLVIVMTDEHNLRTLGCYRDQMSADQAFMWGEGVKVDTPHIDSLAATGTLLTNFYVSTPVCSPSRAAFLTGMYPHQVGMATNDLPLNDDAVTFAEILDGEGYATAYIGKWHLDGKGKPQWAPERKFGWQDNRYMFNRGHYKKLKETAEGPRVDAPIGKDGIPLTHVDGADEKSYATDFLMDRTIEFIRREKDNPFCVMLSLPDPHGPNRVRAPYDQMYSHFHFQEPKTLFKTDAQTPAWTPQVGHNFLADQKLNQEHMAAIFGMVKCIDDNLGRLLRVVAELGLTDHTIMVFTSDHGDLMGEHRRHNKGSPFEASAKVAFLIKHPGLINAGKVVHSTMTSADFAPTVLDMMGIKEALPDGPGRNYVNRFIDPDTPTNEDTISYLRGTTMHPAWVAVTNSRHKLVISDQEDPWLYDAQVDPDEVENFFHDPAYEKIRHHLTGRLQHWMEKVEEPALQIDGFRQWL